MKIKSMCPQYDCSKRSYCGRYVAIPMGRKQLYMMGKGFVEDGCTHFEEVEPVDKYKLNEIDLVNKKLVREWMGAEFE